MDLGEAEKGLPAHKVGRLWKFQESAVDDYILSGGAATDETTLDD